MSREGVSQSPQASMKNAVVRGEPDTTRENKSVMIRAESGDSVVIDGDEYKIQRRFDTYHGPCLKLRRDGDRYQLTAPGPSHQLLLWEHRSDSPEGGWRAVDEVHAELVEGKQYDICPDCGEPLKTPEHRTYSALAQGCPLE